MTFGQIVELLRDTHNEPVILASRRSAARVLCAPSLVGRVMTAAVDGPTGEGLGWIGVEQICKGPVDPVFNNFGGLERLWFGPEGSQFGLHFGRCEQTLANYRVPPCMSSAPYALAHVGADGTSAVMTSRVEIENAAGTRFDIDVERTIRIEESCPYVLGSDRNVQFVGFQSENRVTNVSGEPIRRATGVLSVWTPGQHRNGRRTAVVVPFHEGAQDELGEPLRRDYLDEFCRGGLPPGAYQTAGGYVLFNANGVCQIKMGVSARRARSRLGSIDLETGGLTVNDFDLFAELAYVAPYWRRLDEAEMFDGEAVSVYIAGPSDAGSAGEFHELESLSPALVLEPGESFVHRNRVFHVLGDRTRIDSIARTFLGVDYARAEEFLVNATAR